MRVDHGRAISVLAGLLFYGSHVALLATGLTLPACTQPAAPPDDHEAPPAASKPATPSATARPAPFSSSVDPAWRIVDQLSAHYVLIAHVETEALEQALRIAQHVTEPVKANYTEVLVYFRRPGDSSPLAARRVQWSPGGGYVEVVYRQ